MSTENSTTSAKRVTIRIPRQLRFKLSLRARVVLARLARVGPMSAKKLADEHLGGMVRRERGLAEALAELTELGLVKHDDEGWSVVEPTGEVHAGFRWQKDGKGAWYNRYRYTALYLPKKAPWRKSNALELWCVYWTMRRSLQQERMWSCGMLVRCLGITKKTSRQSVRTLTALGLIVFHANKAITFNKITDEYLTYQSQSDYDTADESPLAAALRELGICDPETIIEKGQANGLYGVELLSFAKRLHKRHDAGKWGEDPSKLILAALKNSKNHKARGGRR